MPAVRSRSRQARQTYPEIRKTKIAWISQIDDVVCESSLRRDTPVALRLTNGEHRRLFVVMDRTREQVFQDLPDYVEYFLTLITRDVL